VEDHREEEICEHCGAKVVEYKHGLSKGLIVSLVTFAQHGEVGKLSELELSYSQRCNFQKMRYWELVEKVGDPDGKGGTWRLTDQGKRFLSGAVGLPKYVWTYRAKVRRYEGAEVSVGDVFKGEWRYKYRPEYAREAQPVAETPPARLMQRELI
jgi:hypothetical protein